LYILHFFSEPQGESEEYMLETAYIAAMTPSGFYEISTKMTDDTIFDFPNEPDSDDSSDQNRCAIALLIHS
jgi:hypothetical protein